MSKFNDGDELDEVLAVSPGLWVVPVEDGGFQELLDKHVGTGQVVVAFFVQGSGRCSTVGV